MLRNIKLDRKNAKKIKKFHLNISNYQMIYKCIVPDAEWFVVTIYFLKFF